jgi:hypothetical protein
MSTRLVIGEGAFATETVEWQVAVAYEDSRARDRSMHLVHTLQESFGEEILFSCSWWKFRYLADPDIALVARHYASAADIVVFCTDSPGLFSLSVMNWIESWAAARRRAGGLLVPLIGSPNIPIQLYSTKHFYLRHVADRTRMDYLPHAELSASILPLLRPVGEPGNPLESQPPHHG